MHFTGIYWCFQSKTHVISIHLMISLFPLRSGNVLPSRHQKARLRWCAVTLPYSDICVHTGSPHTVGHHSASTWGRPSCRHTPDWHFSIKDSAGGIVIEDVPYHVSTIAAAKHPAFYPCGTNCVVGVFCGLLDHYYLYLGTCKDLNSLS